jgi:thiamine pyrophosphate-dependent acetolactate synthase large subunit-like protein
MDMSGPRDIERPTGLKNAPAGWGSDVAADMLRALGIPYISLNPGASYRGFHDSLVNHLGNRDPQMILCLHEEHAVAVAHGYAKVTGKPMAVALHSNVGLMHGLMAIYNAWCDRAPMIIFGATGPVDSPKRRPWIDWIHTSKDQGALLRNYTKWDDQPWSAEASVESIARAAQITQTAPHGPVYICLDAGMQETALAKPVTIPDLKRFAPPPPSRPNAEAVADAARLLAAAKRPVMLMGRAGRSMEAWKARVALAEQLHATVLTDLKTGAVFPTDHPLHPIGAFNQIGKDVREVLSQADVILSLDWVDLGGILSRAFRDGAQPPKVIHASVDQHIHNGWGMDHLALPPTDVRLLSDADTAIDCLLDALGADRNPAPYKPVTANPKASSTDGKVRLADVSAVLRQEIGDTPVSFTSLPRGWPMKDWPFHHPLDYLGKDGGGGLGSGPGLTVGAALALKDSGRIVVGGLGDGDTTMGMGALWTAAHYRLPVLIFVNNNQSYYNDELHQEGMALERNRPVENKWIGQRAIDPDIDIAKLAEAQGWKGYGPIESTEQLAKALKAAIADVRAGKPALLDVRTVVGTERTLLEAGNDRAH